MPYQNISKLIFFSYNENFGIRFEKFANNFFYSECQKIHFHYIRGKECNLKTNI